MACGLHRGVAALAFALALPACIAADEGGDPDRGPFADGLSPAGRASWPGLDQASGRVIPLVTAFGDDAPSAYWFLGFGSRRTADAYFFCRDGDTSCPLDEHRRLSWARLVGGPIFTRTPGDPDFSPFWQVWVVRVPPSFTPDSVKTLETLDRLVGSGVLSRDLLRLDFGDLHGETVGLAEVVLHAALVLPFTELEGNGGPLPDGRGSMLRLETRTGWFAGHGVDLIDFSASDGVFPAARDSDDRALMRTANLYVLWRSCASDPRPAICELPGFASPGRRPVSERGLGQDITGDRDARDTNNVAGALPCSLRRQTERPYSPLWAPLAADLSPGADVALIDTTADQLRSDIRSVDALFEEVDARRLGAPVVMEEDETGNPVPGNEGLVLFNCPVPVPVRFVPFPCGNIL
jgi:hypothetical protein